MNLKFLVIFLFLVSLKGFSQNRKNTYIYIQSFEESIFLENEHVEPINVYLSDNKKKANEIEKNIFKISKKSDLKYVKIQIGNREFLLNLKKYRKNKFVKISVFLKSDISKGKIINIKKDDHIIIMKDDSCKFESCDIVDVQFPQLVCRENSFSVFECDVFNKYIFD